MKLGGQRGYANSVAIPLYLSALLSGTSQGKQPTTKEGILRLFVQQHERAGDHAEALNAVLKGCHTEILMALAGHLNASGATSMSEADARRTVASTIARLREQGQIAGRPEPFAVLEVLTSHHTLMRSGTSSGTVAFQHQQFQEWFASYEVAELMRASAKGDASARVRLRGAILDRPPWEESIYFAVERLSREAGGAAVVAHAVRLALAIDPMLAAEMIYRSSPAVWDEVASEIISFVDRWHAQESVDRAVRFMIITGRPEFEGLIWPLASSDDKQSRLPTLRTPPRFRPSVLGSDIRSKIPSLPEETRHDLLALIASESGVDGMDLATELAEADPSPKVQAEIVQILQFRRADRHVARLLARAHDETWSLVARRGYAEEVSDPATAARLRVERERALADATEPLQRLRLLLEQSANYQGRDAGISAAIADPKFPIREPNNGASLYYAHQRAPAATLRELRQRLEAGLPLPFHADEMLLQLETTDEGPIPDAILDASNDDHLANALAVMAGPKTVEALVDKFVTSAEALSASRNDRRLSDEHGRLRRKIANTRASLLAKAILNRASSADQTTIMSLADLISSHGDDSDRKSPLQIDPADKPALIGILRTWVGAVISAPDGARYTLASIASAIGRCGFPELVPELKCLLDEDLTRLTLARTEQATARRRGRTAPYDTTGYNNHYGNAFSRVGIDEAARVLNDYLENRLFGLEAALALKTISDKQLNLPGSNPIRHWPPLDEIYAARAARGKTLRPLNAFSDPIFAAIDRLAQPDTDEKGQLLAIALTWVALAMPHANQDPLVARVVALPQPMRAKQKLFAAIALDGQVLDADTIMRAIDEWLLEAESNAWQKRQHTWEIEPWLELLPFTNRPESVLDGLKKVKEFYQAGWAKRWERVVAAVAAIPGPQGDMLLARLARDHTDIADDYAWTRTFFGRDTTSSVLLYFDLRTEGVLGRGPHANDAYHVGHELAALAGTFPKLKDELRKRYENIGPGNARLILEYFYGAAAEEDDLIAMVKKYLNDHRAFDGSMAGTIRAAALQHIPVSETSNAYYVQAVAIPRARKFLFGLLSGTPQESALAKRCLITIDALRDENGIPDNDTRHPDVMSEFLGRRRQAPVRVFRRRVTRCGRLGAQASPKQVMRS